MLDLRKSDSNEFAEAKLANIRNIRYAMQFPSNFDYKMIGAMMTSIDPILDMDRMGTQRSICDSEAKWTARSGKPFEQCTLTPRCPQALLPFSPLPQSSLSLLSLIPFRFRTSSDARYPRAKIETFSLNHHGILPLCASPSHLRLCQSAPLSVARTSPANSRILQRGCRRNSPMTAS